jgi:hypothetical protein
MVVPEKNIVKWYIWIFKAAQSSKSFSVLFWTPDNSTEIDLNTTCTCTTIQVKNAVTSKIQKNMICFGFFLFVGNQWSETSTILKCKKPNNDNVLLLKDIERW